MYLSMKFWQNLSPMGKRVVAIAIVFIVAVIASVIGTLTPLTASDAQSLNDELNSTVSSLETNGALLQYIFGNNFEITLIMFIPFIGPIFGLYVLYNTGVAIVAQTIAQSFPLSPTGVFFSLFLTPVAWLEFIAYSTAMAANVWLSYRIVQGRWRHELANTTKFIAICAVLLFVGAIVETALIMSFG